MKAIGRCIIGAAVLVRCAGSAHAQAKFIPLKPGPPWGSLSVSAISADGKVVVGRGYYQPLKEYFAVRWTAETGLQSLGYLDGGEIDSAAHGVSADGSVVVGYSVSVSGREAFRWTARSGMVGLGDLPGGDFESAAWGVSADGSVVVGMSSAGGIFGDHAFRWTAATGMVDLGDLAGGSSWSGANATSSDGSVVVGFSDSEAGREAFRWTAAEGMVGLGDLPGGIYSSEAFAVSPDGSVIVGDCTPGGGAYAEAFLWTAASGMLGLGDLPGGDIFSRALDVSEASYVVGFGHPTQKGDFEAIMWPEGEGLIRVRDYLINHGATGLDEWVLGSASAITPDGTAMIGGGNHGPWVAYLPRPPCYSDCDQSGSLDIDDFICFQMLYAAGDPGADCDSSGELEVSDFLCFHSTFGHNCP